MAGFSIVEAMCFHETGVRINHGNFNWASMSSAFMLWVAVVPKFVDSIGEYRDLQNRVQTLTVEGAPSTTALKKVRLGLKLRSLAFFMSFVLLTWHVYSSFYYLYFLFSTGNGVLGVAPSPKHSWKAEHNATPDANLASGVFI